MYQKKSFICVIDVDYSLLIELKRDLNKFLDGMKKEHFLQNTLEPKLQRLLPIAR